MIEVRVDGHLFQVQFDDGGNDDGIFLVVEEHDGKGPPIEYESNDITGILCPHVYNLICVAAQNEIAERNSEAAIERYKDSRYE
jgi:hypothetical protein